jgi:transposase-like protein
MGIRNTPLVWLLEVVETGRRRRWTPEAKLRIDAESFEGAEIGLGDGAAPRDLGLAAVCVAQGVP